MLFHLFFNEKGGQHNKEIKEFHSNGLKIKESSIVMKQQKKRSKT